MRLLDSLNSQFIRQMACVLDFYAVIKDGNADATTWRIQQSMTKCIRQCFTQCLYRNLQSLFSTQPLDYSTLIQMLEQESHTCIQQLIEIALFPHVVNEDFFLNTLEPSHTQQELRIGCRALDEQGCCCILDLTIFCHGEFVKQSPCTFSHCRCRHTASINTVCNSPFDTILIQIFQVEIVRCLTLPSETAGIAASQSFLKHGTRHQNRCTLNLIIRSSIVGIWSIAKLRTITMHSNNAESRSFGNVEELYRQADSRLQFCHLMCYFPLGVVSYVLAQYLQVRRNAKEQPSAISIQECTQRLHSLDEFPRSLFQFKHSVLVFCYNLFYSVYIHILLTYLLSFMVLITPYILNHVS